MTRLDWIAFGVVLVLALAGLRKGLVGSALSLAGIVVGAVVGARLAPHLLSEGSHSPYTPLAALGGAVVLAALLEGAGSIAGSVVRGSLRWTPLRSLDSVGGLLLGAAAGLGLLWVLGAVALQLPGQTSFREAAQRSLVLRRLNDLVPPAKLLNALARFDPLPSITGPPVPTTPPDPRVLAQPGVRKAAPSVVRVLGTACGLGVEGTGWAAAPRMVVTAAHVVAGQSDTSVVTLGSSERLPAEVVGFDSRNDVAVLRVDRLTMPSLRLVNPRPGQAVAILGYPENGPFDARPGRIGATRVVLTRDLYGHGPVSRLITSVAGLVRHGNSGGPAVDARGAVESTIFAAKVGSRAGYGVPAEIVRRLLARAKSPVSTGDCAA